jgi:hypothetical protein
VGDVIRNLDVTAGQSATIFEELKSGLQAPLAGMGTSFSSSLFGLAGSLILGFLDLQAAQAQNRFYNDLEDWLSSITDIEAGEGSGFAAPQYLRMDLSELQDGIERINETLLKAIEEPAAAASGEAGAAAGGVSPDSLDRLADAVGGLVTQMREEQKVMRAWAEEQTRQQAEIRDILTGAAGKRS